MQHEKYLDKSQSLAIGLKKSAPAAFLILLAAVTYLSLTPISHQVSEISWDKLNHLAAYLCLGVLADMAFLTGSRLFLKLWLLLGYSVLIELAQHVIPNRYFSGFDIFANTLGLFLAFGILQIIQKTAFYQSLKTR